jgi:hypothetical protein
MAKRTKQVREKLEALKLKEELLAEEVRKAEKEEKASIEAEKKHFDETREKIATIAKEAGFFCGVVLTAPEIGEIVKLAINSKESITIPFMLYEIEISEETEINHKN